MLPYNYRFTVSKSGETELWVGHRLLGLVDEFILDDRYITFKYNGIVVRQHIRNK